MSLICFLKSLEVVNLLYTECARASGAGFGVYKEGVIV
jgi:hypothetical protein